MSHIWLSHGTHVNASCHKGDNLRCVAVFRLMYLEHIEFSHVTYMDESCRIYEWVMSQWGKSTMCCSVSTHELGAHRNESHLTHEWVMSHIWMRQCHRGGNLQVLKSTSWGAMWHDSFIYVTWLIHIRDTIYSYVLQSHVTHMNESCHGGRHPGCVAVCRLIYLEQLRIIHVTYMNESCRIYEWVMSQGGKFDVLQGVAVILLEHIGIHRDAYMDESCHTYEWVISCICMSHVAHMNESCHTYEWVISCICMSHVACMNESCRTYEWVMSYNYRSHAIGGDVCGCVAVCRLMYLEHIGISHVAYMDESCRIYGWVMSQGGKSAVCRLIYWERIGISHVTHTNESRHTYEWVMSHI